LHEEEITPRNVAERVAQPKVPQLIKEPFGADEVRKLAAAAKSDRRNGTRDAAIVLFLLDSGCRASELVGLKTANILWAQRMAKVFGKGGKERVVFFSAETMRAMQRYALGGRRSDCEGFFQTEEGRALTSSGLLHVTKRVGQRAKVGNVHPHRFRHTFALTSLGKEATSWRFNGCWGIRLSR
jgi:site-specific recombinase XerD